jgi:hypothetical protein
MTAKGAITNISQQAVMTKMNEIGIIARVFRATDFVITIEGLLASVLFEFSR